MWAILPPAGLTPPGGSAERSEGRGGSCLLYPDPDIWKAGKVKNPVSAEEERHTPRPPPAVATENEKPPGEGRGAGSVSSADLQIRVRVPAARASYRCHPTARLQLQRAATPAMPSFSFCPHDRPGLSYRTKCDRLMTVSLSHSSSLTCPVSPAFAYPLPAGHRQSAVPRLDMPYVDLAVASATLARIRLPVFFPVSRAKDSKNASLPPE